MRFAAAFALLLLPLASAAAVPADEQILSPPPGCDANRPRIAEGQGTPGAQRLGELPAGRLDLAVMRQIGGCPEPVTIREGYGAFAGPRGVKPRPERPAPPRPRLLGR